MSYNLRSIIDQVQQDIAANLNTFIESTQGTDEDWFTELKFYDGAPRVETDTYAMGIYLASPSGAVFEGSAKSQKITVALDCILDDKKDNSNYSTYYLSAVLDFLTRRTYGVSSNPTYAEAVRVDLDAMVNAFSVAIEITVYNIDRNIR